MITFAQPGSFAPQDAASLPLLVLLLLSSFVYSRAFLLPFQISHPLLFFFFFCKIRPNLHTEFSSLFGISVLYFPGFLVIFIWLSQYSLKSIKLTLYFPKPVFFSWGWFCCCPASPPPGHIYRCLDKYWGCYQQQVLRGQRCCGVPSSTQDSPHNKEQSSLNYE